MKVSFLYFLSLLLLSSASANSKMDTTDYWHVLYNKKDIAHFPEYGKRLLINLDRADIKDGDRLSFVFGNDTPCYDCVTGLFILGTNKKQITLVKGKGTWHPLSVSLKDILNQLKLLGQNYLDFNYYDGQRNRFVFKLKFK